MKKHSSSSAKKKLKATQPRMHAPSGDDDESPKDSTVYDGFEIYTGSKRPPWHPVKMMRYVFYRMINGVTTMDALDEIHWNAAEFWHLIDLERHAPFRQEFKRAKKLQGRSFADNVIAIAEGRDPVSAQMSKQVKHLVDKAVRKVANSKNRMRSKMIFSQLLQDLREHDKTLILRNKLQIDASKWIARVANPGEFSDSQRVSLGSPGEGRSDGTREFYSPLAELSDDELRDKIQQELKKAKRA